MTAEVLELYPKKAPDPKCSFCGTPKSKAKHFFSNNQDGRTERSICGACVAKAKQRLQEAASQKETT